MGANGSSSASGGGGEEQKQFGEGLHGFRPYGGGEMGGEEGGVRYDMCGCLGYLPSYRHMKPRRMSACF